jgi:hypothetical protein
LAKPHGHLTNYTTATRITNYGTKCLVEICADMTVGYHAPRIDKIKERVEYEMKSEIRDKLSKITLTFQDIVERYKDKRFIFKINDDSKKMASRETGKH